MAFLRKTFWVMVAKVGGQASVLLVTMALTRLLSAEGYGLYALAMSVVALISIPFVSAPVMTLSRFVGKYQAAADYQALNGLFLHARLALTALSVLAAILGSFVIGVMVWAEWLENTFFVTFILAMVLLPPMTWLAVHASLLKGLKMSFQGEAVQSLLRPLLVAMFLWTVLIFFEQGSRIDSAGSAILVNAAGYGLAGLVAWLTFKKLKPHEKTLVSSYRCEWSAWMQSWLPLIFTAGFAQINQNADILMIGALRTAEEAGVYQVVSRAALLLPLVLMALRTVAAPNLSQMFEAGDRVKIQRLMTRLGWAATLGTLPVALFIIWKGGWLLDLLFGQSYGAGAAALCILAASQIFNVMMGVAGLALNMAGHERIVTGAFGGSVLVNVVLNAALIPPYGIEGAALASAAAMVVWNLVMVVMTWRRLRINSTIFRFRAISSD